MMTVACLKLKNDLIKERRNFAWDGILSREFKSPWSTFFSVFESPWLTSRAKALEPIRAQNSDKTPLLGWGAFINSRAPFEMYQPRFSTAKYPHPFLTLVSAHFGPRHARKMNRKKPALP